MIAMLAWKNLSATTMIATNPLYQEGTHIMTDLLIDMPNPLHLIALRGTAMRTLRGSVSLIGIPQPLPAMIDQEMIPLTEGIHMTAMVLIPPGGCEMLKLMLSCMHKL